MRAFLFSLAVAVLAIPVARADIKFALTGSNTQIQFTGTKKDGKHDGGFKNVTGTALATNNGLTFDVEIDMDSLYADNPMLTKHLKSPDFFGVKAHPKGRFISNKIVQTGDTFNVTRAVTLCGKTEEVTFPAKITLTKDTLTLAAEFKINRNEIGITYGKGQIDDFVIIKLSINTHK